MAKLILNHNFKRVDPTTLNKMVTGGSFCDVLAESRMTAARQGDNVRHTFLCHMYVTLCQ